MVLRQIFCIISAVTISISSASAGSLDFAMGKALFDRIWTSAPSSTDATNGLGPLFNARSCVACHPGGGRGRFTEDANGRISGTGLLLRIGNQTGEGDPTYGIQLQTMAVQGLPAEGRLIRLPNGSVGAIELTDGPGHSATRMSGRLSPDLHGLGLFDLIPERDVLSFEDEDDVDNDGISGRANYSNNANGQSVLSRFGWKAGKASVHMQSAAALNTDIGLSNPAFPRHAGDCTSAQPDCLKAPHGNSPHFENLEIDTKMLGMIVSYVSKLPPRRGIENLEGQELFERAGCAACHRTSYILPDGRKIAPYTDLLLHDMGNSLADGIGDGRASGREWRTAPLWGLKHAKRFLHDGRAKSLGEAIQLHGGEGENAKNSFYALSTSEQNRLLTFLSKL
jgi:CxxC motif-containing protein (DUF1111 family)